MKRILFFVVCIVCLFSCSDSKREYEDNLRHFKNLIQDINTYFLDVSIDSIEISNYYTDDFVFHSYPAGYPKGVSSSKIEYINGFSAMKKSNMSINIFHSIYLPGIDELSHKIDGSVRMYYGAMLSSDTNTVSFSGYQTVNFHKGKISEIWEWADYGGVINQLGSSH